MSPNVVSLLHGISGSMHISSKKNDEVSDYSLIYIFKEIRIYGTPFAEVFEDAKLLLHHVKW